MTIDSFGAVLRAAVETAYPEVEAQRQALDRQVGESPDIMAVRALGQLLAGGASAGGTRGGDGQNEAVWVLLRFLKVKGQANRQESAQSRKRDHTHWDVYPEEPVTLSTKSGEEPELSCQKQRED